MKFNWVHINKYITFSFNQLQHEFLNSELRWTTHNEITINETIANTLPHVLIPNAEPTNAQIPTVNNNNAQAEPGNTVTHINSKMKS